MKLTFDALMKWLYTFVLLGLTTGWAWFSLRVLERALREKLETDILVSSVVSVLLGALITWQALVVQHWFRKAKPEEPPTPPGGTP